MLGCGRIGFDRLGDVELDGSTFDEVIESDREGGVELPVDETSLDGGSAVASSAVDSGVREDAGENIEPVTDASVAQPSPDAGGMEPLPVACSNGECTAFPFDPVTFDSNDPELAPETAPESLVDCGIATFDSDTLAFTDWCDQDPPSPVVHSQPDGPDVVIVPLRSLQVPPGSILRLEGSRPVVLAVYGDVRIDGHISVTEWGELGSGANWSCGDSTGSDGTGEATIGGGGGGGGAFMAHGGRGGMGGSGSEGAGGNARVVDSLYTVVGGCPGGLGGGCAHQPAGNGGGAVHVAAADRLEINGLINADGGNGRDGCGQAGGSGGGSGGGVLLHAQHVEITGTVQARGGRGGNGGAGAEGGARGTAANMEGGQGQDEAPGGGGGGGGVGRVVVHASESCSLPGTIDAQANLICP